MRFAIGGFQKTTFIDYPQKIAAIIFTQGCNFRCGYCHNPELIKPCKGQQMFDIPAVLNFFKLRKGKLEGVVITGGEPCLQKDLRGFIKEIKTMGFSVKLDTNGSCPGILENLINENLLDYIAMDIKAPLEKYMEITKTFNDIQKIQKSIDLIIKSKVDYEFRTTVLKTQLSINDFQQIGQLIKGAKRYYLQKFIPSKIADSTLLNEKNYDDTEFEIIIKKLKEKIEIVELR